MDPRIALFGFGVGALVGLTGVGGGSLMTPLLVLVIGIKPSIAVGTDIAYGAVTKTLGGWKHWRQGTVDLRLTSWMLVGSLPGSFLGVALLGWLKQRFDERADEVLLEMMGFALVLVALVTVARSLLLKFERERHSAVMEGHGRWFAVAIGLSLGLLIGMTSVGSGALIGLALILVFQLTPRRVVGTDVFHAAALLWVAGLTHLAYGNVDLRLAGNILLGSLPGVWLGAHLIGHVPLGGLRTGMGCILLASGLAVLAKAGRPVPPAAVLGLPAALGLVCWAWQERRKRARVARRAGRHT